MEEAGIITENERKIIEGLDEKCIQHPKYWMSLVWAGAVVTRAKKEGRISDQFAFQTIITEINKFRSGCGGLLDYDWISVPLVYTQVVTLAVYTFFVSSLMGRQFLDPAKNLEGHEVDLIVPVFTFLQFFFYMGWLKVAEALINPFGEDDDDFEMNWLIDRNLQVAYLIVDEMHAEHPELVKDQFWDEGIPDELPYTVAAEEFRTDPWLGSTADVLVSEEQGEFVNLDKIDEEDLDPGSDDEQIQIRIEDVKPTVPVNITKNGGLMTIGSESSIQESMVTLQTADKSHKSGSIMSMLHKIFPTSVSQSASRVNMHRIGSDLSFSSKKGRPRRRRRRMVHQASTISTQSPMMSRIQTNEQDIFKMSETSSVNSDSEYPSRRNSEAHALREVREQLKKDLLRYQGNQVGPGGLDQGDQGCRQGGDRASRNVVVPRQRKKSVKERNEAADAFAHTALMKKKLQEVQCLQALIMQELDEEIKLHNAGGDDAPDTSDLINNLTVKTLELGNALQYKKMVVQRNSEPGVRSQCDSDTESRVGVAAGVQLPDRVASPEHKPERGSLSLHIGTPSFSQSSPSSPVAKNTNLGHYADFLLSPGPAVQPMKPISAVNTKSTLSVHSASNNSIHESLFDIDFKNEGDIEEDDSDPSSAAISIIANTNLGEEMEDPGFSGNLGTIPELPELGYQSDSSDTELLLPRCNGKKSQERSDEKLGEKMLDTVPEENVGDT